MTPEDEERRYYVVRKLRWWEFWKPKYQKIDEGCVNAWAAFSLGLLHLAAECECEECREVLGR